MAAPAQAHFATPAWIEIVGEEAARLAAASPASPVPFVLVERYLNAPDACLPKPPLIAGYRLEIAGGAATMRCGVTGEETGDLTVDVDYALGIRLCALMSGPESDAESAAGREAGRIKSVGSTDKAPFALSQLHDAVVKRTLRPG